MITDQDIDDDLMDKINEASYGGLTAYLGFDCAHYNDYPGMKSGTYKDFNFVLKHIKDMIDVLASK